MNITIAIIASYPMFLMPLFVALRVCLISCLDNMMQGCRSILPHDQAPPLVASFEGKTFFDMGCLVSEVCIGISHVSHKLRHAYEVFTY